MWFHRSGDFTTVVFLSLGAVLGLLGLGGVACVFSGGREGFFLVGTLVDSLGVSFLFVLVVIRVVVICFAESYIEGDRALL